MAANNKDSSVDKKIDFLNLMKEPCNDVRDQLEYEFYQYLTYEFFYMALKQIQQLQNQMKFFLHFNVKHALDHTEDDPFDQL